MLLYISVYISKYIIYRTNKTLTIVRILGIIKITTLTCIKYIENRRYFGGKKTRLKFKYKHDLIKEIIIHIYIVSYVVRIS